MDDSQEGFGGCFYVALLMGIVGVVGFLVVAGGAMAGG